ncbi:ferritin-like domain-containing protein [bacterium]|nr:MAG: ferritin-like domain-containing protein [bacterium]
MPIQLEFSESMKRELQKIYSVEFTLADGLKMLSAMSQNPELKAALETHQRETEVHLERIRQICAKHGWSPIGMPSPAIRAMALEAMLTLAGPDPSPVVDAHIIAAAQKSEHFEMACYGFARQLAMLVGDEESAALLQQTLDEEKKTDELLTQIAESGINEAAASQADPQYALSHGTNARMF